MKEHPYEQFTLSSGLRVVYVPDETDSVYLELVGRVGGRTEHDDEVGAAHFLEHIFFDGTDKRPSSFEVTSFLEYYGADANAGTGMETVSYYIQILAEHAETAFDFLSDVFFHSRLAQEDIEKERKVIKQEAIFRHDDPESILGREIRRTLWPQQAVGRTMDEEEANLVNITRDILVGYQKRGYSVENFILKIVGKITKEKVVELGEKYFTSFPKSQLVVFDQARLESNRVLKVINKDLRQTKFEIVFKGLEPGTPGANSAGVLSRFLGQGLSSRLFKRLRTDLQILYSVGANHGGFFDTSTFDVGGTTSEENLQQAVNECFSEINKVISDGFSDRELEKGINMYLSSYLFAMEKAGSWADYVTYRWLFDRPIKTIAQNSNEIRAVTKEKVIAAAQEIFADSPKVVVLTPKLTTIDLPEIKIS